MVDLASKLDPMTSTTTGSSMQHNDFALPIAEISTNNRDNDATILPISSKRTGTRRKYAAVNKK